MSRTEYEDGIRWHAEQNGICLKESVGRLANLVRRMRKDVLLDKHTLRMFELALHYGKQM
jgi:hypothetical protein